MEREDLEVSENQPLDSVVSNLIESIAREGKGFTLGLLKEGDKINVTVEEKPKPLPLRDDWMPRADYRAHVIEDTDSFIRYAKKYGTKADSAVYVSAGGAVLVINEVQDEGSREVIKLELPFAADFNEWGAVFGKAQEHKALLRFIREHEDNLNDGGVLAAMQSVRVTSIVNYESDIRDDGKTLGMVFKTQGGEELIKFPKEFRIRVPVLRNDEADADHWVFANVRLTVELPDSPTGKPTFTLFCPEWQTLHRTRIGSEANTIRQELEDWLVVEGRYGTRTHELGKR